MTQRAAAGTESHSSATDLDREVQQQTSSEHPSLAELHEQADELREAVKRHTSTRGHK